MIINTKSLHYKFNQMMGDKTETPMPKTLCGYFWLTVGNIGLIMVMSVIFGIIGFFLSSPILNFFFTKSIISDMAFIADVFYIIAGISLVVGLIFNKSSFGRMIWNYILAIKDKYCPLIEYKEE